MRRITIGWASVLFVTAAAAQTTHVVGPGGFAQLDNALAVAAPGDVILVQSGTYSPTAVTFGVTIRGLSSSVSITSINATLPTAHRLNLVDLHLNHLVFTGGSVSLDNVTTAFTCRANSSIVMVRASAIGAWIPASSGLIASDCSITAIDSSFQGASLLLRSGQVWGRDSIDLTNSTFHGSRITCRGGDGWPTVIGTAVRAVNSTVWISDSTLIGGAVFGQSVPSACPVLASQGRLARCTLDPNCPPAIATTEPLIGVHQPDPLQSPGPFTLEFQTDPNELVGLFFATGLGITNVPGLEQPILLDVATTFHFELLTANALGLATQTWSIPAGLANLTFFFQAVGTVSAPVPLQLSPVGGGIVR